MTFSELRENIRKMIFGSRPDPEIDKGDYGEITERCLRQAQLNLLNAAFPSLILSAFVPPLCCKWNPRMAKRFYRILRIMRIKRPIIKPVITPYLYKTDTIKFRRLKPFPSYTTRPIAEDVERWIEK